MKPDLSTVLALLAERIEQDALPALGESYAGAQLQRGLPLLATVAEELNRAAAWRVEEIEALRTLFRQAAHLLPEPALAASLQQAADAPVTDLHLNALDARLHGLRSQLITLQVWTESNTHAAAATLNAAVWHELRLSTERRRTRLDRF